MAKRCLCRKLKRPNRSHCRVRNATCRFRQRDRSLSAGSGRLGETPGNTAYMNCHPTVEARCSFYLNSSNEARNIDAGQAHVSASSLESNKNRSSRMRTSVHDAWLGFNKPLEGRVKFMYCDVKGLKSNRLHEEGDDASNRRGTGGIASGGPQV